MEGECLLVWKKSNKKYLNGENGYLGSVPVCSVFFDELWEQNDPKKYVLTISLAMHDRTITRYEDPQEAKEDAEEVVSSWLKLANLKVI